MLNVAAPIWNRIAETGLTTPFGKQFFPLDEEEMSRQFDRATEMLEAEGNSPTVVRAYLEVAPLLLEREAISKYVTTHPQQRSALPEINTIQEAVLYSTRQHRLTGAQQRQLERLLSAHAN